MISRLFAPVMQARLFDPMPLPRRVKVLAAGRYRAPRSRVEMAMPLFARNVKKIPMNR